MLRTPVSCKVVASVGYEDESYVLEVEFHSGKIFQYSQVPREVYERFLTARSKGRFFHHYVRDRFPHKHIR